MPLRLCIFNQVYTLRPHLHLESSFRVILSENPLIIEACAVLGIPTIDSKTVGGFCSWSGVYSCVWMGKAKLPIVP